MKRELLQHWLVVSHRSWNIMDPSIIKLLEEDEDESMHCSADVEAFQAALNRDIGGDTTAFLVSDPVLSHEPNQTLSLPYSNEQTRKQDENANCSGQKPQRPEQISLAMNMKRHAPVLENQLLQNDVKQEPSQLPEQPQDNAREMDSEKIPPRTRQTTRVQISDRHHLERPGNVEAQGKLIPFMLLMPALKTHLDDKDKVMQLQTLYSKLRKNEIGKENFVRLLKNVVGDQVLRLVVSQFQSQLCSNQSQLRSQAFAHQQNLRMPTSASASSVVQVQAHSNNQSVESNPQKPREAVRQPDSHGMQEGQISSSGSGLANHDMEHFPMLGLNKQKQHLNFPQTSFPRCVSSSGTFNPYSGTNLNNSSGSCTKLQPHDLHMMQISHHSMEVAEIGGSTRSISLIVAPKFDRKRAITDPSTVLSAPFSSSYAKQDTVEHSSQHLQKSQPTSQAFSVALVEQGNAVPGNLKDESLEKQSSKVGFPTPASLVPLNSIPPSIPIKPDSNAKGNAVTGNIKDDSVEKQSSRVGFPSPMAGKQLNSVPPSAATQLDPNVQVGSRISTITSTGVYARTPPGKPSAGQKKSLEELGSSPPASSKKQKVSGGFLDQSIEQLNDVTAVSGVDLREEEEHLLHESKEESRASEASRKVVQEEEGRLILQKIPLQKKLAEITLKCGLKNVNNDVERCLSLCAEERLLGLISNLIRLSKQRVDAEMPRHRIIVTTDVRQHIMTMNKKANEEWEKNRAEAEKLKRINEPEGDNGINGDKEKDENRLKMLKVNKEEVDKMKTIATNAAARAAVGGDDMLSKWQLMAEQGCQKLKGANISSKSTNTKDSQATEMRSPASASRAAKIFGRNQAVGTQKARSISVKDVIAVLEREPQMSKSILIYRLYERIY